MGQEKLTMDKPITHTTHALNDGDCEHPKDVRRTGRIIERLKKEVQDTTPPQRQHESESDEAQEDNEKSI